MVKEESASQTEGHSSSAEVNTQDMRLVRVLTGLDLDWISRLQRRTTVHSSVPLSPREEGTRRRGNDLSCGSIFQEGKDLSVEV